MRNALPSGHARCRSELGVATRLRTLPSGKLILFAHRFWQSVRSHLLPPLSLSSNTELSDWYDEEASTSEPKPGYFTSSSRPSRQASTNSTTKKDVEPVHVVVLDRSFKDLLGDQAGVTPSGRSSGDLGGTTPTAEPPNDDYLLRRGVSDLLSSPSTTSLCQPDTTPVRSFLSDYRRFPHHARQFVCKTLPLTVWDFFESHFDEAKVERAYRRETWAMSKPQAITAAVFLSIAWLVTVATQAQPLSTFVKIAYCGVGVASIAPVIPMVAFNGPQRWPWTWQIVLFVATWTLPYVIVFDLWNCHFYGPGPNRCPQKDFSAHPNLSVLRPPECTLTRQNTYSRHLLLRSRLSHFLPLHAARHSSLSHPRRARLGRHCWRTRRPKTHSIHPRPHQHATFPRGHRLRVLFERKVRPAHVQSARAAQVLLQGDAKGSGR